ncbi:MAG: helix-turn-helix domain-containing protein [Clostridia bacterium]|nr:helix-turn-helix domain-containing protein [Clostridia bacterium]
MLEYDEDPNALFKLIHRYRGLNEPFLANSLHWHKYYELEFIYDGKGTHILSKSSSKMYRGYACLRTPMNIHSTLQDMSAPLKLYNIKFSEHFIPKNIATHLLSSDNSFWVIYDEKELEEVIDAINRLAKELQSKDGYSESVIKAVFTEIFVSFIRKYDLRAEKNENENPHVQSALKYINNNFRDDITLKSLAEHMYLSPNYLGNLFIKEMGQTCSEYIQGLRFTLAIQLLLNTELSVKEITDQCGFHSTSYFIRKFREKYGEPPMQYRANKRTI